MNFYAGLYSNVSDIKVTVFNELRKEFLEEYIFNIQNTIKVIVY